MTLIKAIGYKNIDKGLRRYHLIENGQIKADDFFINGIALALGIPDEDIRHCINLDRSNYLSQRQNAYETSFTPHAILLTQHQRPQHLFVVALLSVDKLLKIKMPLQINPIKYPQHALSVIPDALPCFGRVTGFVINYKPSKAVEFDLSGKPIAVHPIATRVGQSSRIKM